MHGYRSQIPRTETGNPGGAGVRADIYISKPWGAGAIYRPRGTVGDLSITHPLNAPGTHPDGTAKVGRWWYTNRRRHPEGLNVHSRWGAKKSKHSNYFLHGLFMVPLVASTFVVISTQTLYVSLELCTLRSQSPSPLRSISDW